MDLLTGYGSDSGDEPESPTNAPSQPAPPVTAPVPPAPADDVPVALGLSTLPAPAASQAPLFSGLPAPARKKRRLVPKFSCGIDYGDVQLPDDDDDVAQAPAVKKLAVVGAHEGAALSELLPAPTTYIDELSKGRKRLDTGQGSLEGVREEEDEGIAAGPSLAVPQGNEAYRVDASGASQYIRGFHEGQEYLYDPATGQYFYPEAGATQQGGTASRGGGGGDLAVNALEQALAAEQARVGGAGGLQFKEVSGDALRHMNPSQKADLTAIRSALGEGYESKLKADAARVGDVNKTAKRKHQLASLFVQAKAQELEDMEKRASGMKTKAETQRKYGW